MISAFARLPSPAAPRAGWLARLLHLRAAWANPRPGRTAGGSVTALMIGSRALAVRVDLPREPQAPLRLRVGAVGAVGANGTIGSDTSAVRAWKRAGLFRSSTPLLVLGTGERQLLTLDQPAVPDAEVPLAVRWPLAEAMDLDAQALLTTAVPLPRINDAQRTQVLAVGAALEPVRTRLAALRAAGVAPRSIDIIDSALRGMALLQRRAATAGAGADATDAADAASTLQGQVVLASVGNDLCIGLLQQGRFCAVRTLAQPASPPRDAAAFEEQLALHLQRTADSFERQATQLAVRETLAWLPSIDAASREDVRRMLPLSARWFEPGEVFTMDSAAAALLAQHDELAALACVAAARLLEPAPPAEVTP